MEGNVLSGIIPERGSRGLWILFISHVVEFRKGFNERGNTIQASIAINETRKVLIDSGVSSGIVKQVVESVVAIDRSGRLGELEKELSATEG